MPLTFNVDAKRVEEYELNPLDIKTDNFHGRWDTHTEEEILAKVKQFETDGQLQQIICHRLADKSIELIAGWGRTRGAIRYNELHPDKPMKIRAKVFPRELTPEEKLNITVAENKDRKKTSPMDDAAAQEEYRKLGWNDVKIAERYGMTQGYVSQLKKLLTLSKETQRKVHSGELAVGAAISLNGLSPEEQAKAVESASTPGQKRLSSEKVKQFVREKKIGQGKAEARSMRELRQYFLALQANTEENEVIQQLAGNIVAYADGKISDKAMTGRLHKMIETATPV